MKKQLQFLFLLVFITHGLTAQNALNFAGGTGGEDTQSIRFDDDSDKTNLLDGATSYTIEAWVKPNGSIDSFKSFFSLRNSFRVTMASSNRFYFTRDNGSGTTTHFYTAANALTPDVWQHIAVICDAGANTLKLYVNGVDVSTLNHTAISLVGAAANNDFFIGYRYDDASYVNAKMREIRVKNVASTIASLNTTTFSSNYATDGNTAFLFHFAEGAGLTTVNTASGTNATFGFSGAHYPTWITPDTNTWTGATDTAWNDGTNWSGGITPTATTDIMIPNIATQPITGLNVSFATLTLQTGSAATFTGTITNTGIISVDSGASLIAGNAVSGNVTYKRNLTTTAGWYLVSSPVTGETIEDYLSNNRIDGTGAGTNVGLAPYLNDGTAWSYFVDASTGALTSGKGYSTKASASFSATTEAIAFTGAMPVADVSIAITDGATNEFNLIGNPYPSYIPLNTAADAANNILTINGSTGTNQLSEDTVWFWDQSVPGYVTVNLGDASRFIAPAQGFFVSAKAGGGSFSFTEAMQSHQTTDVFSRTPNNRFEITLSISDGSNSKSTNVRYIEGKTTGFDNGYDSSMFSGVNNDFAVYTQNITNNQGKNLAIQSLPNKDYSDMIIPVGINAVSGAEITFSAEAMNLPTDIFVFLEDRTTNSFTRLDETNATYKVTLSENLNSIGRFYIHTTTQEALGVNSIVLENVSVYKTSNASLRIVGLQQGNASLKIVNLLGKQVLNKSFTTNGVSNISLPKLATGIYIVQLQTENGKLNKKIIIE